MNIEDLINKQFLSRENRDGIPNIKVNLYKGYEVEAIALAMEDLKDFRGLQIPDCIMVADSYLNTHLNRTTTHLNEYESELFLCVFLDLIYEVRLSLNKFLPKDDVYLIADMPDGSYSREQDAIRNANLMIDHGSDVIKIELGNNDCWRILEKLSSCGICTMAHIGYTPQSGENRSYGQTEEEARYLFSMARRARDSGASALVIERVSVAVNKSLSKIRNNSLPIYSVFSGKSLHGGQSLNVWDSVIRPSFKANYFPPTAVIDRSRFPREYNCDTIRTGFGNLLRLALTRDFPKDPVNNKMDLDTYEFITNTNPWAD